MVGRADVVEFHGKVPYPVEYKHGSGVTAGPPMFSSAHRGCAWMK